MTESKLLLPVITGATASGKTAVAVQLCKYLHGEVVGADSMQVYRGMDILSAAPTEEERGGVPHHMVGIANPADRFTAARYRDCAKACIADVYARGLVPVVCGGTGLYIDALTRPMRFAEQSDEALHAALMARAEAPEGKHTLHLELQQVDPDSAARLHENDVRRVVRALEIYRLTGITQTEQNRRDALRKGDYDERIFALDRPRDVLYRRIDTRVDLMVRDGLIDEVRRLMYSTTDAPTAAQAIGYKEIAAALVGRMDMSEAIALVKQASRNYAKRQLTWLRRDARTIWVPAQGRTAEELALDIAQRLGFTQA